MLETVKISRIKAAFQEVKVQETVAMAIVAHSNQHHFIVLEMPFLCENVKINIVTK